MIDFETYLRENLASLRSNLNIGIWASKFDLPKEKIIAVVYSGDTFIFNDIEFGYDDITANIVPVDEIF